MMKHPLTALVAWSAALFLLGCQPASPPQASEETAQLTVAVAASMRPAFEEIIRAYGEANPGVRIEASYGASGTFFAQLTQKAPFDLFLSADTGYPEKLVAEGHAEASFPYAVGRLVLWASKDLGLGVATRGMEVLGDERVHKISIANPELAPYGRAAMQTMEHYQSGEAATAKLVRAENVAQAAQFAQSGAAQVGFFADSLAKTPEMAAAGDVWMVPQEAHAPIVQAGAVLPWSRDRQAAEALRDYLLGPEGRAILEKFGFGAPQP